MFRFFTIIAVIWRFGLDDVVLSAFNRPTITWRKITGRRYKQPAAERLRLALEYLGPIFVKFGQMLSTRRDILPATYADELAKLQDRVPPETDAAIEAALQQAYRCPLSNIFSEFDRVPVGSASVAQVHRARLASNNQEVAVKVLRPAVNQQIRRDLKLMNAFATLMQFVLKDGARLKPRAFVNEFSRHLEEETNLMREAANCAQLGRNFSNSPVLRVPAVHWPWCTEQIFVMDFLHGIPISRVDEFSGTIDKSALARTGIDLFFTQVFRDNFFHADMHPGNIHVDQEGHLLLFDYGIVGQLSNFDKEYLLRNFLAFFDRDYRRVAAMHVESGWVPADTDVNAFEADIRAVCEPIFAQPLKNISFGRFLLQMFQTARRFNLEAQPQLILLQKTLLSVESMGRELDPDIDMWKTAKPILNRWSSNPYRLRQAIRLIKQQLPDWLALLANAPVTARTLLNSEHHRPNPKNRNKGWWPVVTIAALSVAIAALAFALTVVT